MTTLNKLPNVKSDLVRLDDDWESWGMPQLIDNLQIWLKRNKTEEIGKPVEKREKHWYAGETRERHTRKCIYCDQDHWSDKSKTQETVESRRSFFRENKLCFNCGKKRTQGG